ncbi:MAG: FecR domain-containing protein [Verrucomicrobiales bacterium]|nr:FecR domain-containing protein [Verrucomicrobiales bacterium]
MNQESDHENIDFELPDSDSETNRRIKTDPDFRRDFAEHWLLVAALDETLGEAGGAENTRQAVADPVKPTAAGSGGLLVRYGGWAVAALLMIGLFLGRGDRGDEFSRSRAQFTGLAKASFFGELVPPVNSHPELNRNYSLVSGAVELAFPDGAKTIIEGPAVFRVVSDDRLALDTGQCSVHCPEGAEGFRVDTPSSRVVDRGTRFHVSVSELNETEVQVVEGAADIYPEDKTIAKEHLTDGSARRVGNKGLVAVDFSAQSYRSQVPDRVISYEATKDSNGRAKELLSVTVQRDGKMQNYAARDLIPVKLVSFNPGDNVEELHVFGDYPLPVRRASLVEDLNLNGGIINPGGSNTPLKGPFDMESTPGFGIQFLRPVTNGPGPDLVFFEVQNPMNPAEGDAFHVSPLVWEEGKKSHTIRQYDLMMTASEALSMKHYHLFFADESLHSASILESANFTSKPSPLNSKALAVGIDLSDLGYQDGEQATGLFFQDADDDRNHVDPIIIRGLPNTSQ